MLKPRRRPHFCGAHLCAFIAALLLFLSLTVLHTRIGAFRLSLGFLPSDGSPYRQTLSSGASKSVDSATSTVHLIADDDNDKDDLTGEDPIDELDGPDEEADAVDEEDDEDRIARVASFEEDDMDNVEESGSEKDSGLFWDHVMGVGRRRRSAVDSWDDDRLGFDSAWQSEVVFASDDQPLDEGVRTKLDAIRSVEDVLLLKTGHRGATSVLRDGWARWFEKKGDFLRRDRMFRSNLEDLNPLNNPMLQDPDTPGVTSLTKGDKLMQKAIWSEMKRTPFARSRSIGAADVKISANSHVGVNRNVAAVKKRITLDETKGSLKKLKFDEQSKIKVIVPRGRRLGQAIGIKMTETDNMGVDSNGAVSKERLVERTSDATIVNDEGGMNGPSRDPSTHFGQKEREYEKLNSKGETGVQLQHNVYADGKRWGYFPGLDSNLSFLEFMDQFFAVGKCSLQVFMVWNSPSWMYGVRHQRGIESLFYHDRDACVVVFSETVELDFFGSFVDDGFRIAVVMPNLDELLKDTPGHVFASVWHEWRKIPLYYIHYSELVRLAALYKYGGIYLDSDVILLKSLHLLRNSIAIEDQRSTNSTFNGAVMAFERHSSFLMECLMEFYLTYDDTRPRWNGADLLTRVINRLANGRNASDVQLGLKIEPPFAFFPISSQDITGYLTAATSKVERAQQDILFEKIVNESVAFHFWNSITSSIVPEPESLVERLLNHHCLRCLDVL